MFAKIQPKSTPKLSKTFCNLYHVSDLWLNLQLSTDFHTTNHLQVSTDRQTQGFSSFPYLCQQWIKSVESERRARCLCTFECTPARCGQVLACVFARNATESDAYQMFEKWGGFHWNVTHSQGCLWKDSSSSDEHVLQRRRLPATPTPQHPYPPTWPCSPLSRLFIRLPPFL